MRKNIRVRRHLREGLWESDFNIKNKRIHHMSPYRMKSVQFLLGKVRFGFRDQVRVTFRNVLNFIQEQPGAFALFTIVALLLLSTLAKWT